MHLLKRKKPCVFLQSFADISTMYVLLLLNTGQDHLSSGNMKKKKEINQFPWSKKSQTNDELLRSVRESKKCLTDSCNGIIKMGIKHRSEYDRTLYCPACISLRSSQRSKLSALTAKRSGKRRAPRPKIP